MALPRPQKCRLSDVQLTVEFELEFEGRVWRGEIDLEAVQLLGGDTALGPAAKVAASTLVTRAMVKRIRALQQSGDTDGEPIVLTILDFRDRGG